MKGKLLTATRRQNDPVLGGDVTVTETYRYSGVGGRASQRTTDVSSTSSFSGASFNTTLTYDNLGMTSRVGYPRCTSSSACAGATAARNVDYAYTQGWLTSVGIPGSPSAYASLTWQPSGITGTITHAGLLKEQWIDDATTPGRPCAIFAYSAGALVSDAAGPCGKSVPSGSALSWTTGAYAYDGAGNITQIGTKRYVYDGVNRLVSSGESATTAGVSRSLSSLYAYDAFGNMTSQSTAILAIGPGADTSTHVTQTIDVDRATNRLNAATYDTAGNMLTTDASSPSTYAWDAVGTMRSLTESARELHFLYTADDERVAVVAAGPSAAAAQPRTTWTLRGVDNKVLREYVDDSTSGTRTWSWSEDEIWRGASTLANESTTGTKQFVLDHLGSPRIITDGAGNYLGTNDFSPFGSGGTTGSGAMQFTGHERDWGTDATKTLDYMHARYYSATIARFLSVDPLSGYAQLPQSMNRYAYVRNSPLNLTDPTGTTGSADIRCTADEICDSIKSIEAPRSRHEQCYMCSGRAGETITVTAKDPGRWNAFWYRVSLKMTLKTMGHDFSPAEVAAMMGDNHLASYLMSGGTLPPHVSNGTVIIGPLSGAGREIRLAEGYYEADGSAFRFSEYYYERLMTHGRPAPFLAAQEVYDTATVVTKDYMPGFYRYTNGMSEMVYNPTTGEVWHLGPQKY